MAKRFRTVFEIDGDSSGAVSAQRAARKETELLTRSMTDARVRGEEMTETFGALQQRAATAATVIGATAAAVGGIATRQILAARNAGIMADALEMTTRRMQELQYAADRKGISDIGDILKDVADKIGDAYANGGGEAKDAIDNLGLSVERLIAMDPDEQLLAIAQGLDSLPRGEQVNVMESLGNDAVKLLPLLEDNGAALEEFAAQARDINVALSAEDNQLLEEAGESIDRLQGYAEGLANTLTLRLAPGINDTTEGIGELIDDLGGMEGVVDRLATGTGALAAVVGARLVTSLGAATVAAGKKLAADLAQAQAETTLAAAQVRRTAAEKTAAMAALRTANIEARATAGTNAHAFSLQQLSAARVRAAEAAGAHASATQASAAAMSRAQVIAGRLKGALTLVGGPVGALMLAAGAAYTFRDELGLTIPKVDASSEAVHQLTGELDDMSRAAAENKLTQLNNQLADLKATAEDAGQAALDVGKEDTGHGGILGADVAGQVKQLQEISETAKPVRQDVANVEEAIELVEDRLEQLNETGDRTPPTLTRISEASKEAEKAAREQASALEQLRQEMNPMRGEAQTLAERVSVLNQGLADGTVGVLEHAEAMSWAAEQYMRAANGAEEYEKRTESLVGKYDRHHQRAKELQQALQDINARYKEGAIDGAQYRRMVGSVREEMGQLAEDARPFSEELATVWERGLERMDDAGADMWRGFLDGTGDAMDQFEDIVIDMVAEVAHNLTTRKLIVPIQAMITGEGQAGGGMMGSGQSGGMDMGTLVKAGKWGYDQLFGSSGSYSGGWAGSATAGASSAGTMFGSSSGLSSTAINSANAVAGGAGGSNLGWTSYGSGGGLGTSVMNAGAGMAASMIGAEVGDAVSGALTDKQANSNYGQTAGAMIGSIWGPVGTGIGSALGSVVDSLFGSGGTPLTLSMQNVSDKDSVRGGWDNDAVAQGGLGYVGFDEAGSHEIGDLWEPEEARQLIEGVAELDTIFAKVADSSSELKRLQDAAQDLELGDVGSPDEVLGRFSERYQVAFDELGSSFDGLFDRFNGRPQQVVQYAVALDAVDDALGGNRQAMADARAEIERYSGSAEQSLATAQAMAAAAETMAVLESATDRLDIQFDATADGAIQAASGLAQMVGGAANLASLQQNYYDTMLSAEQRYQHMQSDMQDAFASLGFSLPRSEEGFRELVKAQDLNTEAGRENYAQLLQLVDGFDALRDAASNVDADVSELDQQLESLHDKIGGLKDNVQSAWETFDKQSFDQRITLLELAGKSEQALALQREQQLEGMDPLLQETQEHIWALKDEKEAQQEAAQAGQEYAKALADARSSLGSTFDGIAGWLDQLQSTDQGGGTPREQLTAARSAFSEQLQAARGGDRTALQNITQYADRLIDAQRNWSASGGATSNIIERIENQLGNLPDQVSAEQFIADEVKQALIDQTANITSQLAEVLRSDTPSNIAGALAGSFDDLTRGVGDVLTREQLALVMGDKATDAQIKAVMRAVDLNGDGVMSGLEAVIIKGMPTDATLANALQKQLRENGKKSLTAEQARDALSGIARKPQIDRLINRSDKNSDGIITEQEIANSRLAGLADGIGGALSPMFDSIDLNADELIDYNEFGKQFKGLASDKKLKSIFDKLDDNGDGTITELEALSASTEKVDDNTKSLEERSLDQLTELNSLVGEMTRTTDQFVDLNSTMTGLRESINLLVDAQDEVARIDRSLEIKSRAEELIVGRDRARGEIENSANVIRENEDSLTDGQASRINRILDRERAKGPTENMDKADWDRINTSIADNLDQPGYVRGMLRHMAATEWREQYLDLTGGTLRNLRQQYRELMDEPAPFAKGGVFTNSVVDEPTMFNMGVMGEANPEAIMPLHRGPDGGLGIRAELPPIPSLPLLGESDIIEAVNDLRREVAGLRAENKRLLGENNQHAAAGVRVNQAGFQQQIGATERGNKALRKIQDRERMRELAR